MHVRVEVAAALDRSLPDLADAVRARIAEVADRDIGIRLGAADVLVVDILDEDDVGDDGGTGGERGEGDEYDRYGTGGAAR
ncbi:hypothetical protein Smic_77620 [Streptomyces microflavus]|uniref:Asp23 family, cell envelope-related function n=1 Tax=Streptomyces microflavus TaxID=1919 RepID=A0A7J0D388_STRMI|nr:hypothetical protein Smic_77620 [Streptomyces microflavus]